MTLIYLATEEKDGQCVTLAEIMQAGKQPEPVYASYPVGDKVSALQFAAAEVLDSGRIWKDDAVTIYAGIDITPVGPAGSDFARSALTQAMRKYAIRPHIVVGGLLLPGVEKKLGEYLGGNEA